MFAFWCFIERPLATVLFFFFFAERSEEVLGSASGTAILLSAMAGLVPLAFHPFLVCYLNYCLPFAATRIRPRLVYSGLTARNSPIRSFPHSVFFFPAPFLFSFRRGFPSSPRSRLVENDAAVKRRSHLFFWYTDAFSLAYLDVPTCS